jgi:hypothetical protein
MCVHHGTYSSISMRYQLADYGVYCTNVIVNIYVTKMNCFGTSFVHCNAYHNPNSSRNLIMFLSLS